jgi:KDO2-lipid IV(A) lauroyltransferase
MAGRRRRLGRGKRAQHLFEYGALRLLVALLSRIPRPAALWIARRLGDLAYDLLRLRRRVTLDNLARAFGDDHPPAARRRIARGAYRAMGMTFIELALFPATATSELVAATRLRGVEHLRAAAAAGRGIVYLTAHVGNWESCGAVTGWLDEPPAAVIAEQRNPFVDRYVRAARRRVGLEVVPVGSALRALLRRLRRGGRIALVADQDAGRDGIFLDFMGTAAATATGPARLAYRSGAPIVIGFDRHLGGGRHEIQYHPPIEIDRSRPEAEETRRVLGLYLEHLEAFIRKHPEQYFWMHRRWKTRPPGNAAACGEEEQSACAG